MNVILPAVLRTGVLALGVSLVSTVTAAAAAWYTVGTRGVGRAAEGVLALPLASSSVILGLGRLILLRYLPGGDAVRILVLGAAHTVSALPFSYRIIAGRLKELPPRISQAARVSGAGALQTFIRVELPLARRAVITAAVFALALSAGELSAAMVLAPGNFTTVPLAVYRLIGSYDFNGACALGTLLIGLCLLKLPCAGPSGRGAVVMNQFTFKNIQFRRGSFNLQVNLTLPKGKLTVILGPSGLRENHPSGPCRRIPAPLCGGDIRGGTGGNAPEKRAAPGGCGIPGPRPVPPHECGEKRVLRSQNARGGPKGGSRNCAG